MNARRAACAALALTACSLTAHAAPLQVTVVAADGSPAANVVVVLKPATGNTAPPSLPAPPVVVTQHKLRFSPAVVAVRAGGTVRFVNQDEFEHHIVSLPSGPLGTVPPIKAFGRLMPAAEGSKRPAVDVTFESPGSVVVGCHLHGSMRGHIFVSPTPWFTVTDMQGHAVIDAVPSGVLEIVTWHPDQLVEQEALRLTLGAGDARAQVKLNFTPKSSAGGR
jgi:plastocyanin